MNDEAIIAELTHSGAHVEDYVLIGRDGERLSIITGHSKHGLATLLVEEEEAHAACVELLIRRGARRYSTIKEFADAIGSDGVAHSSPASE